MRAPRRAGLRLRGYDYSAGGLYFVTTCTAGRVCHFGDVVDGRMQLNDAGRVVEATWRDLPRHYAGIRLDAFVVMPNHFHGVIAVYASVGAGFKPAPAACSRRNDVASDAIAAMTARKSPDAGSFGGSAAGAGLKPAPTGTCRSLTEVVRAFKTFSSREINAIRGTPGRSVWQRTFHDHVIRNDHALDRIRQYIAANPANWPSDPENPRGVRHGGATKASPLQEIDSTGDTVRSRERP